jgi:hypothetical protein
MSEITSESVGQKIKYKLGNGRGTLWLAIIGGTISTASSFMFCLASIGFDFSQLSYSSFWSRWASMFLSTLFTYILVLIHKDEVNRLNDWYVDKMTKLTQLCQSAGVEFEAFLKEYNLQRRVTWYVNHINGKIAKLNSKRIKKELKNKSTAEIDDKIKTYRAHITDEYIEANKYSLKTKSRRITAAQVLTEAQRISGNEENFRSASVYYGGKGVVKLCLSLFITAAFASVVVKDITAGITVASITMLLFTVLSMILSVVSAIMAADGCFKYVYTPNILFKIKILSAFNKWREEGHK